jgi:hypothetical protein
MCRLQTEISLCLLEKGFLCHETQPDALIIHNLFRHSNLYMFRGMFIAHHQEVFTVCAQQLVRVIR